MANKRFIDFPIATTVGDNDIILIWQGGANKQTTKATILSGVPDSLNDLTDVTISGLTNGQILRYDSVTGQWENTDQGNLDLNDLNDVTIVSPTNGQVLVYNSSTSKWENSSGGYVPYVGAVTTVDLGLQGLEAGYVRFDTSIVSVPDEQGLMYWDASRSTVALIMNGTLQHIGQDTFFYVKNSSGSSIPKGTCVRFAGTDGASGHLLITPFLANGSVPSTYFLGVTAETITNGSFGQVMHFGELEGINTSSYTAGALLYASTTVAGAFQTTAPVAPNNIVLVAAAVNSKNNGAIVVRPTYGSNINNDEGVKITSPTTGDLLQLQAGGLWENKTLAQVIGSAYVPSTRTITINGTTQDLSANRTYNVGTVTSVAALTLGTSGTDLSSSVANGTTTPVITLNVPTASATNRGALSSADWSTFNAKQNALTLTTSGTSGAATLVGATLNIPQYQAALTNPVTGTGSAGQVAYWSSASAITGESALFWDATNNRLGIDASSPSSALEVRLPSSTLTNNIKFGDSTVGYLTSGSLGVFLSGNDGISRIMFTHAGDVGIGNNGTNGFKFDVTGTGRFTSNLTANSFIKSGGTSSQYLMADGSVSTLTNPVTGTGVSGRVAFWNGTNSITSDADLLFNGSELNVSGIKIDGSFIPYIISTLAGSDLNIQFPVGQGLAINNNSAENIARIIKNNFSLSGASTIQTSSGNLTITSGGGNGSIILTPNGSGNTLINAGNLGLGVTPSAWGSSAYGGTTRVLELGELGSSIGAGAGAIIIGNNWYSTNSAAIYSRTGFPATYYAQNTSSGQHQWYNAPSGTAGNAISFNQAMTLTSGGNLLVGTPSDAGQRLQVSGSIYLLTGGNRNIRIGSATNYYYDLQSTNDDFQIIEAGSTPRLTIKYPNGNVGIGTASPQSTGNFTHLDVVGKDTSSGGALWVSNSNKTTRGIIYNTNSAVYAGSVTGHDYILITSDIDRFRISSTGFVSAGATTNGRLGVRGFTNDSSGYAFEAANASGNTLFIVRNDGATSVSGKLLVNTFTPGSSPVRLVSIPTSSSGLSSGDVWNDGGTLKIV